MTTTLSTPWILPLPRKRRSITRNQGRSRLPSFTIFSNFEVKRRRSAHYHPTIWETSHIESFVTPYTVESTYFQITFLCWELLCHFNDSAAWQMLVFFFSFFFLNVVAVWVTCWPTRGVEANHYPVTENYERSSFTLEAYQLNAEAGTGISVWRRDQRSCFPGLSSWN